MSEQTREESLYYMRKGAWEFWQQIKGYPLQGPVIEIGKMVPEGKIYEQYKEFFLDTKKLMTPHQLIQVDIDPSTKPDVCADIVDIESHFEPQSVGAVVMLHVLEHVTRFWLVPEKLHKILKPGGYVFIQTPWNFRFHGPRPDCWRISDDGYTALFKDGFQIIKMEQYNPLNHYLHPLAMNIVVQKI